MNTMKEIFGVEKPMIGMVHLPPLPGSPLYDEKKGMAYIREVAIRDAQSLLDAGFDGLSFSNEGDRPYQSNVDKVTVAALAATIREVTKELKGVPFGLSVLADPEATIAIGTAVNANFARIFLSWVYVGDWGIVDPCASKLLRIKANYGARDMKIIANISGHTSPLGGRKLEDIARGAVKFGLADAVCLAGSTAGAAIDMADIEAANAGSCGVPVVAGTGVSTANLEQYMPHIDAAIVGTHVKYDHDTFKPVDPAAAKAFIEKANQLRK